MKKIAYIFSLVGVLMFNTSCQDELETAPTNQVPSVDVFRDATSAQTAVDGIYRMVYTPGWSQGWGSENPGQTGVQLLADLMGEDHVMMEQGQGWFYEDYRLNVHGDYVTKAGRSYSVWNLYYTLVNNANQVIASEEVMDDKPEAVRAVVGQALAMRAFSYFYLAQIYQQTYKGHEDAPGVPMYTEPTTIHSKGKGRGTVKEVYAQINEDLEKAATYLKGQPQEVISHVDYYVVKGFQARAFLVQHKYAEAAAAAEEALKKDGLKLASVKDLGGNNNVEVNDVMWGVEIIPDQSAGFAGFFSHMDADAKGMYAARARKCISAALYNMMSENDDRRAWFRGKLAEEDEQRGNSMVSYCQLKFKMANYKTRTGDHLFMRAEEMVLIKAEAECHLGKFAEARETLKEFGELRDPDFEVRLAARTDASTYNSDTNAPLVTLMDEILFQRRVELWGEAGRVFDLQRLGLGYNRKYDGSNHTQMLQNKNTGVASPLFIFPLPQSEIDGNENISNADQNPVVQ